MSKSKSSRRWLDEHFKDEYVKLAQKEGWRSRAVYKLMEIDAKDHLLKPGMTVVDLGAAPGGWSQYALKKLKPGGQIIAIDLLPIEPLPGVKFLQGDFSENSVYEELLKCIDNHPVDLVMSDIAPNISGMPSVDNPRAMYLVELALDFATTVLRPGGAFLVKVFQSEGFDALLKNLRQNFKTVKVRKPKASRSRSREVYLLGLDKK